MKKYRLLLAIFVFLFSAVVCRVPENLMGTDIFPEAITITTEVKTGFDASAKKPITEERQVILPTKALNLAYGAECFTVCLQPLYQFGDLIRLEEKVLASAGIGALSAAGAGNLPAVGGISKTKKTNFYQEIVKKEPLTYEQCNPLALLVRALFWQNPGTSGLGDFRVSQRCIVTDGDKRQDMRQTMQYWADAVALTVALYKLRMAYPDDQQKINSLNRAALAKHSAHPIMQRAFAGFETNMKSPYMLKLLCDGIGWAERFGFGKDFPLRVLMGGVYALAGESRDLVQEFYRSLQEKLVRWIPELATSSELERIERRIALLTEVPVSAASDESEAAQASKVLNNYFGPFMPIRYRDQVLFGVDAFPDCVETMIRNIVCALLVQKDGSYAKGLAIAAVDDFLEKYSTIALQLTPGAYNAWAAMLSQLPGVLYRRDGRYEVDATFVNVLFMLDYLFDLQIEDFNELFLRRIIPVEGDGAFIRRVLPKVNAALALKISVSDAAAPIVVVDALDAVTDTKETTVSCRMHAPLVTLLATVQCHKHGEVDVMRSNIEVPKTGTFKFLHRALVGGAVGDDMEANLVFLQSTLTRDQIKHGIEIMKDKPTMLRMLYAVVAGKYESNDVEYVKCLMDGVAAGVWHAEALILITEKLATARPLLKVELLNLFEKLLAVGEGIIEARTMIADESLNKTIKPVLRRLLTKYNHAVV